MCQLNRPHHCICKRWQFAGKKHISVVSIWWMKWCRTIVWMTVVIEINWSSSREWGTISISTNDSSWNTVYLTNSTIKKIMRSFCISREFGLPAHTHTQFCASLFLKSLIVDMLMVKQRESDRERKHFIHKHQLTLLISIVKIYDLCIESAKSEVEIFSLLFIFTQLDAFSLFFVLFFNFVPNFFFRKKNSRNFFVWVSIYWI